MDAILDYASNNNGILYCIYLVINYNAKVSIIFCKCTIISAYYIRDIVTNSIQFFMQFFRKNIILLLTKQIFMLRPMSSFGYNNMQHFFFYKKKFLTINTEQRRLLRKVRIENTEKKLH